MIELYLLDSCPYCKKVIEFMEQNNIEYLKHDVSEPENYAALQALGGKSQVPFLSQVSAHPDRKLHSVFNHLHYYCHPSWISTFLLNVLHQIPYVFPPSFRTTLYIYFYLCIIDYISCKNFSAFCLIEIPRSSISPAI